jgi:hypothetical protein
MDRRMDPRNELHLRAAVERLAREGRSQREIESTVIRMLGGKQLQPGFATRLRRVVGA